MARAWFTQDVTASDVAVAPDTASHCVAAGGADGAGAPGILTGVAALQSLCPHTYRLPVVGDCHAGDLTVGVDAHHSGEYASEAVGLDLHTVAHQPAIVVAGRDAQCARRAVRGLRAYSGLGHDLGQQGLLDRGLCPDGGIIRCLVDPRTPRRRLRQTQQPGLPAAAQSPAARPDSPHRAWSRHRHGPGTSPWEARNGWPPRWCADAPPSPVPPQSGPRRSAGAGRPGPAATRSSSW